MDRSLLSDKEVITASREFVCIRTATYEDKQEAEFLKSTIFGGARDLRNFGYCLLAPDGKTILRRSSRGPNFVYANSTEMAKELREVAKKFPRSSIKKTDPTLPQMKSVRLGLNVASCDGLLSIVVVGVDKAKVDQLSKALNEVVWRSDLIGKFIYSSTTDRADLEIVEGTESKTGILIVEPNVYGTRGKLIAAVGPGVTGPELRKALLSAAEAFKRPSKNHRRHVRVGRRNGEEWETEVPVPDRRRRRK